MGFNYKKSITFRLAQAAKAHRARSGVHLARIGMHPGQEAVLKTLADTDGLTMSELAATLGVQPPTVTKMITRMSGQRLVRRQAAEHDGRLAQVCLTDEGRARVELIDRCWKRLEREALAGVEDKDRKKLRKLLRVVERNLAASFFEDPSLDDEIDAEDSAAMVDAPPDPLPTRAVADKMPDAKSAGRKSLGQKPSGQKPAGKISEPAA